MMGSRLRAFLTVLILFSLVSMLPFEKSLKVGQVAGAQCQITQTSQGVSDRISLGVDKRIELLTAVQLFTNWTKTGIWKQSYPYKEDMLEHFGNFSDHRAVAICENLIASGFSYDAPVGFMMHLSDPPELNVVIPFSEYHIMRAKWAGGKEFLEEFVEALRSFCSESNFDEFWDSHQDFYDSVERRAYASIPLESTVKALEDYFGAEQHAYRVTLAPLFLGNYAYWIKVSDSFDIYAFLCPMRIAGS